MSNLVDLQLQIEKLQKQAAEIKAKEFDKTVKEILAKMQAFGITLKDLQRAAGKTWAGRGQGGAAATGKRAAGKRAAKKVARRAGRAVAAKYRGPSGETWSGRGLTPRWLAALVAQGHPKEEFAVKA